MLSPGPFSRDREAEGLYAADRRRSPKVIRAGAYEPHLGGIYSAAHSKGPVNAVNSANRFSAQSSGAPPRWPENRRFADNEPPTFPAFLGFTFGWRILDGLGFYACKRCLRH